MNLTTFKKELKKIGGVATVKKSVTTNSIYIEILNNGVVKINGRISDHNKSFQHEGDISVILGDRNSINFAKVSKEVFKNRLENYGFEEFLNEIKLFISENEITFEKEIKQEKIMRTSDFFKLKQKGKITRDEWWELINGRGILEKVGKDYIYKK